VTAELLRVDDVVVEYKVKGARDPFRALRGVSVHIEPGETLGLVGESGSGKTTLGRAILGLAPIGAGTVTLSGRDITRLTTRERRALSSDLQVVFQDPYSSLNPSMTVGDILSEPLRVAGMARRAASDRIRALLDEVKLPVDSVDRFPREFSGGQRQRIAIARALALEPKLIVCDEPVSALDLSTQKRVLDLFIDIQERTGVAYLFITHDLSVVRHVSHRVAVMYRGEIVEQGDAEQLTSHPSHPYTQRLFLAAPVAAPAQQAKRRAERERLLREQAEADVTGAHATLLSKGSR